MANQIASDAGIIAADIRGWGKPPVVRSPEGTIYTGYINTSGILQIYKSVNLGSNWTLEVSLDDYDDGIIFFNLDIDGPGNVYVCINHGLENDIALMRRAVATGTWTEMKTRALGLDGSGLAINVLVCHNKILPSRIYQVWCCKSPSIYEDANLSYSDDAGDTWTDVLAQNYFGSDGFLRGVDIDPVDGRVYLLHSDASTMAERVLRFDLDGSDFAGAFNLSPTGGAASADADILIDIYRHIWVAHHETSSGNLLVESFTAAGVATGLAIFTSPSPTNDFAYGSINLGTDGAGNLFVFYQRLSTGKSYYAKYDVTTGLWGTETELQTTATSRLLCEKRALIDSTLFFYTFYKTP